MTRLKVSGKLLCFISAVKDSEPVFIEEKLPRMFEQLGIVTDGCVIQPVEHIVSCYSITMTVSKIDARFSYAGMYVCCAQVDNKQIELNETQKSKSAMIIR